MKNLLGYSMLALVVVLLTTCGAKPSVPASTSTSAPTFTPQPSLTTILSATFTPYPVTPIAGLVMVIHEIKGQPELDPLQFTTLDGRKYDRAQMGSGSEFNFNWVETPSRSIWVQLGNDKLVATESHTMTTGKVLLTQNDQEIYNLDIGPGSPVSALRGLWTYDTHWVLEAARITQREEGNGIYTDAVGQIVEDGVLLNKKYGYEEAFGFQTINDKPFYFFKRNGKIDALYDGQKIPLGFNNISHYGCCSGAELNPLMLTSMVAFFGLRGDTWYLVQIGEKGTFNP